MKVVEKKLVGETIGETEGARRATGVFPIVAPAAEPPVTMASETEVVAKALRRRFTAEYKRRIVREAERCTTPGGSGALLRREGLYSSSLTSRRATPRPLPAAERRAVWDLLHEPRFVDLAPAQVYAGLLDDGRYLCSERTMYRILEANQEVRERRDQRRHPHYAAPQLLATAPNQLWSWDITKLLGPVKWTYFYLYVILDVFSRYVVGWMVAHRESAALAEQLIRDTCARQGIVPGQLT